MKINVLVEVHCMRRFLTGKAMCALLHNFLSAQETVDLPAAAYHIYSGNTHAHTSNSWSHGDHFINAKKQAGEPKETLTVSPDGVQSPPKGKVMKPDWQQHQGGPAQHYAIARTNGYDFYAVTDHSQDFIFHPVSATNAAWVVNQRDAAAATDASFVALPGYEHSENNGPDGKGHFNVFNSAEYLNALAPGNGIQRFSLDQFKRVTMSGQGIARVNWKDTQKANSGGETTAAARVVP